MAKGVRISTLIPHLFAFTVAVFFFVHDYVFLEATAAIGRPSSTFAIGYFFLPIYALVMWVLGYLPGYVLRLLLRKFNLDRSIAYTKQLLMAFCITLILSAIGAYSAYQSVVATAARQTPRVISTMPAFVALTSLPDSAKVIAQAKIIEQQDDELKRINWQGTELNVSLIDNQLQLDLPSQPVTYDFTGYTYATWVKQLTTPQWLALLIKLRPTSGISMLLIYDKAGRLAHEELVSRCQPDQAMALYRTTSSDILSVSTCEGERLLRLEGR